MKSISLNIAILPDEKMGRLAISLSKKISHHARSEFTLDGKHFFPDITLYQACYPRVALVQLEKRVAFLAREIRPFEIRMGNFTLPFGTFVSWNCKKSRLLLNAHKKIVRAVNSLRKGLILPHLLKLPALSARDRKEIAGHGSLHVLDNFKPHLTVTRIARTEDSALALSTVKKFRQGSFLANEIVLGYLGPHGTITKIVSRYKFPKI